MIVGAAVVGGGSGSGSCSSSIQILIFILPILIAASLDMSMEGVQYPVVYYLFLGYLFAKGCLPRLIT